MRLVVLCNNVHRARGCGGGMFDTGLWETTKGEGEGRVVELVYDALKLHTPWSIQPICTIVVLTSETAVINE